MHAECVHQKVVQFSWVRIFRIGSGSVMKVVSRLVTPHNFHLNARDNPPATTAISEHAVKKTTVKPFVNLNGTKATRERWAAAAQRMVVRSLLAVAKWLPSQPAAAQPDQGVTGHPRPSRHQRLIVTVVAPSTRLW
jgi:hypothetical protein